MRSVLTAALALCGLAAANSDNGNGGLPVIDLGYELHQAAFFNATGNYYNFSNIRYAAPPVGDLRFAAPQPPAQNRSTVQDGSQGHVCPQANPAWGAIAAQFIPEYLTGRPINITTNGGGQTTVQRDPREDEDCLFLDVAVPKDILDQGGNEHGGAPVLVWIYGGGYTAGDKSGLNFGNPSGLIRRSNDSIIYVAINYRLGALGWLSGPTFQVNGTANAGLHDQRFALQWIQQYISRFGGDPNRVTVIGESAGGGSIMHQITAYGGMSQAPFQQAILQSPGFQPIPSNNQQEQSFQDFLSLLNVSSLAEARQLPSSAVIQANLQQVGGSRYGSSTFGPTVDGDFVPALPGVLLLHGQYTQNLKIMVGHNSNEGLVFTSPFVTNDTTYRQFVQTSFPGISPAVINYIDGTLYPESAFRDGIARLDKTTSEVAFECNTFYLDLAFNNQTYSYFFDVPPGLHGQDVPYTYYNDGGVVPTALFTGSGVANVTVALALQDWIVTFTRDGVPSAPDVPAGAVPNFVVYGPDAQVERLGLDRINLQTDDAANERCRWWQKALYF